MEAIKSKILWKQDAAAINSVQCLIVHMDAPFLVTVPNEKVPAMIKGDNLEIDQALLFNAMPIKQWCPIRSPWIR